MSEHLTRLTRLGHEREQAQAVVSARTEELCFAVRDAHEAGVPKVDIARAAGVSRPTVDKWLKEK